VSGGAQTGSVPVVIGRSGAAALLALVGACVLLGESVLAALLLGFDDPDSSPLRTVLLLGVGALLAAGAALRVRSAPRSAALLCLLAAGLGAVAQLPFFVERLQWNSRIWLPYEWSPGQTYAPLLAWIAAAAPLVCAAVLALREASRSKRGDAA